MQGTNSKSPRCNALDGEIGKAVSCSIYLNRPSPCREFDQSGENGLRNEACDRARERYGLPPLPVPLPLSLPETTIVEEIGVVQFAGATAAWNRVQSPTDLSLFSRRQGVCMPITANALYRDSFNFYATNWPAS